MIEPLMKRRQIGPYPAPLSPEHEAEIYSALEAALEQPDTHVPLVFRKPDSVRLVIYSHDTPAPAGA